MKQMLALKIGEEFWVKPGIGIDEKNSGFGSIGEIITNLLRNVYVIAGILLFILLIVGGFSFIMGAGEENPEKAKKGKQAITVALIGFVVIFCAYWIIRIVEILTGIEILKPKF